MASPIHFTTSRREPPAGPVLTPAEYADSRLIGASTVHTAESKPDQSNIHCRPSRAIITTWFLGPTPDWWSMEDFMAGHEPVPFSANTPRGRLSTMDQRRNIDRPPAVSYGDLVGNMDGVSPNGLD